MLTPSRTRKGVEKDIIFEAIEAALASATRRKHGEDIEVRVAIDRETGEYDTWRRWLVFEDESTELEVPDRELRMIDAVDVDENAEPGGFVEVPMESVEFGRIAAQTAKQVIVQKVREAEREQVVEEYQEREGEMLSGLVKRVDRNGVYIDLGGNAEGFVPRTDGTARAGPSAGSHQGAADGSSLGAPWPAAVHDAYFAAVPRGVVQNRGA